jgi:hypothetical protein
MSQEERSILWEVTVSVILSKNMFMYVGPVPNGFRDRAISLYSTLYPVQRRNTPCPHTSCKVHWYWRWNFRKCIILGKLYQLWHLNNISLSSQQYWICAVKELYLGNRSEQGTCEYTLFCLEWPILWPPRILSFPPGTSCIWKTRSNAFAQFPYFKIPVTQPAYLCETLVFKRSDPSHEVHMNRLALCIEGERSEWCI